MQLGMSYGEILRYAELAAAAYDDPATLEPAHGDSVRLFDLPGCQIQVVLVRDHVAGVQWIAVRGTANAQNVLSDGRIKIVRNS